MVENPQRPSRLWATFKALMRTRVTAGLLVVLPIWVTYLLVKFVFGMMRDASLWVVEAYLRSPFGEPLLARWQASRAIGGGGPLSVATALERFEEQMHRLASREEFLDLLPVTVKWGLGIAAVLLTILILYMVGLFTANIFGRKLIEFLEGLVDRVPLVKTVYRSAKQIIAAFTGESTQGLQRVALVPFPHEGMRCVGFVTDVFRDAVSGEELCAVFIPTTPNPTTGYLQVLRRKDLTEVNWSIEDGVRTIMSAGILRPSGLTMVTAKDLRSVKDLPPETIVPPSVASSPPPGDAPRRAD